MILLFASGTARAATYNYVDNASSGSTAIGAGTACTSPLVRTINVPDSYVIGDVKLGFVIQHAWRGDVQITVTSPSSTSVTVVASVGGDNNQNWNIELDDDSSNPLDNNSNHSTTATPYQFTVGPSNALSAFDGENANGNWSFSYCDTFTGADNGNLLRAELIVEDTVTGGSGGASSPATGTVINSYARVNSIGGTTLSVSTTSGFTAGGRALVVQMQGASVTTSDTASHGDITSYNSAGRFEYVDIISAVGGTITIASPLTVPFNTSGAVQIVSVPIFNGTTLTGTIVPRPWDGNTGGVVALDDTGTLTMAGDINTSGHGFRGGVLANNTPYVSCSTDQTNYTGTVQNGTGNKGEGITANSGTHAARRGHRANGGGGGNVTDAGGGGGANVGAGGVGGRRLDLCDTPVNGMGGLGGQALNYSPNNRLFMGGGGGSGSEVSQAATGGDRAGGGLIFVRANDIVSSGGRFISDGLDAAADNNNGSDGGGAAGAIAISVRGSITGSPITEVIGGDGGDEANTSFAHGTGGGGGGGAIRLFGATCSAVTPIVDGGDAGVSALGSNVGDPNWGAQDGGPGNCLGNFSEIGVVPLPPTDDYSDAPTSYNDATHTVISGMQIGATAPDADAGSFSAATIDATGDDIDNVNDENSISTFPSLVTTNASYSLDVNVTNTTTNAATLYAWIDFNIDGSFDAAEFTSIPVPIGSNNVTVTLNWTGLSGLNAGDTFVRLRLTSNTLADNQASTAATDGEVEDYQLTVIASPDFTVSKTSVVYSGSTYQFAVPGSDALYSILVTNGGEGNPDNDSLFMFDALPTEVSFYNGDIDDGGPETNPISFTQTGAGLTFSYSTDVAFSDGTSAPTSMADCTYSPISGYDANVRFICINPKGVMASGDPDPQFTVQFRARIE